MSKQLSHKIGAGVTPKQFIDGMTKNKEAFVDWMERFQWENEEIRNFFVQLNNRDDIRCLILSADWCGDVIRNVPVVFRVLEESGIPTEVLIKEQHEDVMDEFLTMGGKAIPIVIFVDTGGFVLGQWGPRPQRVQEPMVQFKQENPDREAADYQANLAKTREEIGRRYGEGTAYHNEIVQELRDLLSTF